MSNLKYMIKAKNEGQTKVIEVEISATFDEVKQKIQNLFKGKQITPLVCAANKASISVKKKTIKQTNKRKHTQKNEIFFLLIHFRIIILIIFFLSLFVCIYIYNRTKKSSRQQLKRPSPRRLL